MNILRYFVPRRQKGCPFWAVGEYLIQKNSSFSHFFRHHNSIESEKDNINLHPAQRKPIPLCQSKQIAKQRKPIAIRIVQENTGIPPLLLHQEVTEVQMLQYPLPVKTVRGPSTPTVLFIFKKEQQTKNKPSPPHTDDPIAMYSRYGVLDVEGGGDRTPSSPLFLFLSCLFLCNGICVACRPTARSSVYFYLNITPQPSAYKKLYSVIKQLPSRTIHTMAYLLWKITAHFIHSHWESYSHAHL